LLCPSLASTLRNPILPKAVSKRKYVGLDDPNFDEDVEKKRPDAGHEYDPDGDYIYDARKYFNPEKYREIIAHQEEKKKKQQEPQKKFYYRAFRSNRRHYHSRYQYITDSGYSSVNYVDVRRDRLSSSASALFNSEYPTYDIAETDDIDELQHSDGHRSSHHKKRNKKSSHHSKHRSHTLESSRKHAKRKKSDVNDKKHKKKRKRKKSDAKSLCHEHHNISNDKHHTNSQHTLRHRSKSHSSQEPSGRVTKITSSDYSYGCHPLDQNSVGNDCDSFDPSCLPDDSASGSNCNLSPYPDSNTVDDLKNYTDSEDSISNYAKRTVIAHSAPHVWNEDSSVSSEYSYVNQDVSGADDK